MPKERRQRTLGHESSVKKVAKRQFAVQDNAVVHVDVGASVDAAANDILDAVDDTDHSDARHTLKKKDRRVLKHELFIERLEAARSPYSKSHARRLKRKDKEQIAGGLAGLRAALTAVESTGSAPAVDDAVTATPDGGNGAEGQPAAKPRPGQIGEGKGAPLKRAQRKQALKAEQFRLPKILANPDYAANPFKTIRTHAQNTLILHRPAP
ncbi:hypothetical protein BV25DRAFT_1818801 [Artomyces pyxidatus]|uniref:Uncharacterized protein n=1 Tax=Artomyces pyxidatus TaxID=48021 RepID=A0ACB8TIX2_9AGAM|nr:hypothetical protein BV25DRAFT_1818801 [Artomyces pyxidatus]